MLTPQQIQDISFEKALFGGYDMDSVDDILEPLTEDYVTLYKENSVLKSKMRILVEKLEEYRKQEASMQNALLAAQKTCDQMVADAEKTGPRVTVKNDARITRVGKFIRKYRLDEVCQLLDVWRGKMTFVGTRPEVEKYVAHYTPEMRATLLLPAGITSEASIYYKDESALLDGANGEADRIYLEKILPEKMKYNLRAVERFSLFREWGIMIKTVLAVCGKNYRDNDRQEERQ